jgi:hypothetical protein
MYCLYYSRFEFRHMFPFPILLFIGMRCISLIQILLFQNDGVPKTAERLVSRGLSWLGATVPSNALGKGAYSNY